MCNVLFTSCASRQQLVKQLFSSLYATSAPGCAYRALIATKIANDRGFSEIFLVPFNASGYSLRYFIEFSDHSSSLAAQLYTL